MNIKNVSGILVTVLAVLSSSAYAQSKSSKNKKAEATVAAPESSDAGDGEMVEVEKVKSKYWAQGEEAKLGVVQNRAYTKTKKFELGVMGGLTSSDPFLSVKQYGGQVGYNFNEYWALSAVGWKYNVGGTGALDKLIEGGKKANTVKPEQYFGVEGTGSFLYGKLSLLGAAIIYYDMHVSLGAGMTKTENDSGAFTGTVGVGQRFYITQALSLRMDYRLGMYGETVIEKEKPPIGKDLGKRTNFAHNFMLTLAFMFGGGTPK